MEIGLAEANVESLVGEELLASGRYTLTAPGGWPVFTREQRDAIARAVSRVIARNNDAIERRLREAGVGGLSG
jgi:hypothetical protein